MNEGMRCDRISLMNAGKVLACDAPRKLIEQRGAPNLEEAFIGYMEDAIAAAKPGGEKEVQAAATALGTAAPPSPKAALSPFQVRLGRLRAYMRNETMQILRDPVRLAFAFLGSALLMLVFGFGITSDVEHIRYTTLDLDNSPESQLYLANFVGTPRYFTGSAPAISADDALKRLQADDVSLVLEIPPDFGRRYRRGFGPEVRVDVDGAMTYRGNTIEQYVQGVHNNALQDPIYNLKTATPAPATADIQPRFLYNPTFDSVFAIVPSVPALLLLLIPAILMTVSIVREKELGSMINFYVTPTGRLEYLLGKQLPYVAIGMINFVILTLLAMIVFRVPIKGSFLMLTLCTLLYTVATTGIGMVTSIFTSSQVAAVFVTAILTIVPTIQFSGLLQPISTLTGSAAVFGKIWPAAYYMHTSLGAYTKGLGARMLAVDVAFMAVCIPVLVAVSVAGLRKQEK